MSQLAKKRHKGNPALSADLADNSPKSSASDEAVDENHPESVSHRKYQKRLQKNRDSAFVSRIRRREYTRVLEETLNTIEKEKESAVNCLLDMKTRFEIVCAELAGMKNAALSNMATMGASVRTRLSASDDQTPGPPASTSSSDTHAPRSGTVTTMFMMALMFGVLMPNLVSRPPHAHGPESPVHRTHSFGRVLMSTRKPGDATLKQPAVALSTNAKRPNGRLWGIPSAPHAPAESDTECEQDLIADICRDVRDVLGAETSVVQQFMNVVKRYIESLSMDEVALLIDELKRLDVHDVHLSKVGKIETVLAKVDDGHTDDESGLLRDVERQLANTRLSNESEC